MRKRKEVITAMIDANEFIETDHSGRYHGIYDACKDFLIGNELIWFTLGGAYRTAYNKTAIWILGIEGAMERKLLASVRR